MTTPQIVNIECAERVEGETMIWLGINEAQLDLLAAGIVPSLVKAQALGVLHLRDEDERKAARPAPKRTRA
jgi:hypothetical protein